MSAFIVSRKHISYLVQAAQSRAINRGSISNFSWIWNIDHKTGSYQRAELANTDRDRATEVGQMLWDENIKSVHARYPDDTLDNLPGPCGESFVYEHRYNPNISTKPIQVLKACDCFEYQSCEHDEWETSEAKAFIDSLRSSAWHALPGYEESAWEISEVA